MTEAVTVGPKTLNRLFFTMHVSAGSNVSVCDKVLTQLEGHLHSQVVKCIIPRRSVFIFGFLSPVTVNSIQSTFKLYFLSSLFMSQYDRKLIF